MKRALISLLLSGTLLCLVTDLARPGGPIGATGTTPRRYAASSFPLRYWVDQGTLGAFSNATGVAIANYAFQQWANVKSATLSFTNAGYLSHDVTSAADPLISGSTQFSDGINPVVFDNDGSITDAKLGMGAHNSVLGFAGSAYSGNTFVEGYAIINGTLSGGGASSDVDRYEAVLTHEIGHFLGLAHAQVSMHSTFCTMYPVIESSSQKILGPDDTTAIANLYPAAAFLSATGSITGTVKSPTGAVLSGVNVIAMDSATGACYSTVVDYFSGGNTGFTSPPGATGTYTFSGLHPGKYFIRIEPLNASFTGGSDVASYYTPINTTVAREWWNGSGETGDMLTDNTNQHTGVVVNRGSTTSGINFISNQSATLTTLVSDNGTPYYIWSLPQSTIVKYAIRCVAPAKGSLVEVQFRLDPSSSLPAGGTMTIAVQQNTAGSYAGIPGTVLGSVTIPYTELATDQMNEIYLRGLGNAVNFDSNAVFHISFATNGVGSPVFYTDNGSPSTYTTSYQTSDGTWRNFPDGGWTAGYNLIAAAVFSKTPISSPTVTNPAVSLSPTSLNYGSVNVRTTLDRNVRLTNSGTAPLNVTGASILGIDSLDYAIVTGGGAYSLNPGAYHDYTIRFQPCNTAGPEGPTRSAKFVIVSNAATSPDNVPLVGTAVMPAPAALVPAITFHTVRPGVVEVYDSGVIFNTGMDTLHSSQVAIMGMGNDTSTLKILTPAGATPVAPDSTYHIMISFSPTNRQNYQASLRMLHDGMPGYTDIPIYANAAAGELTVRPSITFNATGTYMDSTFTMRNTGNAPLFIKGLSIAGFKDSTEGAYFLVSQQLPLVINPGDSATLHILFSPAAGIGEYYGTLMLQTDSWPDTMRTVQIHASVAALDDVDDPMQTESISVAPNPAQTDVTVRVPQAMGARELQLFDLRGEQVMQKVVMDGGGIMNLEVSSYPSGEYYLIIQTKEGVIRRKLVITK